MPPILSVTDAVGNSAANVPVGAAAAVIAYEPALGTLTVTSANLIEPSGHRFLTSVCVVRVPTFSAAVAAPWGRACPNVAQPAVSATDPIVVCAFSAVAARIISRGTNTVLSAATDFCMFTLPGGEAQEPRHPETSDAT